MSVSISNIVYPFISIRFSVSIPHKFNHVYTANQYLFFRLSFPPLLILLIFAVTADRAFLSIHIGFLLWMWVIDLVNWVRLSICLWLERFRNFAFWDHWWLINLMRPFAFQRISVTPFAVFTFSCYGFVPPVLKFISPSP